MTLAEKTSAALAEYLKAKKARKDHAKILRDMEKNDETLADMKKAKTLAAGAYKAERTQFILKNETAYAKLDDFTAEEESRHQEFTDLYAACLGEPGTQLSLFAEDGRKVEVELKTAVKVEKEEPTEEPADASE